MGNLFDSPKSSATPGEQPIIANSSDVTLTAEWGNQSIRNLSRSLEELLSKVSHSSAKFLLSKIDALESDAISDVEASRDDKLNKLKAYNDIVKVRLEGKDIDNERQRLTSLYRNDKVTEVDSLHPLRKKEKEIQARSTLKENLARSLKADLDNLPKTLSIGFLTKPAIYYCLLFLIGFSEFGLFLPAIQSLGDSMLNISVIPIVLTLCISSIGVSHFLGKAIVQNQKIRIKLLTCLCICIILVLASLRFAADQSSLLTLLNVVFISVAVALAYYREAELHYQKLYRAYEEVEMELSRLAADLEHVQALITVTKDNFELEFQTKIETEIENDSRVVSEQIAWAEGTMTTNDCLAQEIIERIKSTSNRYRDMLEEKITLFKSYSPAYKRERGNGRNAVLTCLFLALVSISTACSTFSINEDRKATASALILDVTHDQDFPASETVFNSFYKDMDYGTILTTVIDSTSLPMIISNRLEKSESWLMRDEAHYKANRQSFKNRFLNAYSRINNPSSEYKASYVFSSLAHSASQLQRFGPAEYDKSLIVFTDCMQHSPEISFYKTDNSLFQNPDSLLRRLEVSFPEIEEVDLTDVKVMCYYSNSEGLDDERQRLSRSFFKFFVEQKGGTVEFASLHSIQSNELN